MTDKLPEKRSEIILYPAEGGRHRIEVRFEDDTVWLSQRQLSNLYDVGIGTINHHIKEIYDDGELSLEATIRRYRIVQPEGGQRVERTVEHYNLDMILAVGYRVRSLNQ
jgi:hypothetical protein